MGLNAKCMDNKPIPGPVLFLINLKTLMCQDIVHIVHETININDSLNHSTTSLTVASACFKPL